MPPLTTCPPLLFSPDWRKFAQVQVSSTLPLGSKPPHSLGHSPCLAYRPPEGYHNLNFLRLNVVCDFMFYGHLSPDAYDHPSEFVSQIRQHPVIGGPLNLKFGT
ncbi:hypothetical protein TNCV_1248021 [Trichonephila clavipes]|nr:hypothetical protein TNCV_1248021 [Trichonephila clavipes]